MNFEKFVFNKSTDKSFSRNDICRVAAYFVQNCKCYVTDKELVSGRRELHHRTPKCYGGTDKAENLVLLEKRVHKLVHSEDKDEIVALLSELKLSVKEFKKVNQLRLEAHREVIAYE